MGETMRGTSEGTAEGNVVDARGFGLLELVIALFLLTIIALAMLPALYDGIMYSSDQASSATATRYLNQLVERAREQAAQGSCAGISDATTLNTSVADGSGHTFSTFNDSNLDSVADAVAPTCTAGNASIVTLNLRATTTSRRGTITLATLDAKVYVP